MSSTAKKKYFDRNLKRTKAAYLDLETFKKYEKYLVGSGIMIDGNARDFIEKLHYEDHYAIYNGEKFFFNGCQVKILENGKKSVKLEVYNLTKDSTVFSVTKSTATDCVEAFQDAPIWNGKSFWEIENQIQWVDE